MFFGEETATETFGGDDAWDETTGVDTVYVTEFFGVCDTLTVETTVETGFEEVFLGDD